jgi:hypothetical protein
MRLLWRKLTRDFPKRKLCLKSDSSNSTVSAGTAQPRPRIPVKHPELYQNSVFFSPSSGPEPSTRSFASSWPCSTLNRYVARALTDAASFAMLTCICFDSASGPASRFHGRFAAAGRRQINTSLTLARLTLHFQSRLFFLFFFKSQRPHGWHRTSGDSKGRGVWADSQFMDAYRTRGERQRWRSHSAAQHEGLIEANGITFNADIMGQASS